MNIKYIRPERFSFSDGMGNPEHGWIIAEIPGMHYFLSDDGWDAWINDKEVGLSV